MLGLRGMVKSRIAPARHSELDELLNDAYFSFCPKPTDYQQRRRLVHRLKAMAKEAFGNSGESPVIEEFGSFVMDMFSPGSDLDLSINFSSNELEYPREKKIKALRKFSKKLTALQRKGVVDDVQVILGARVPIVKVTDCETGIECDLSVENRDGVNKSQIIYAISTIDDRFHRLCILLKAWAKGHNINSSKDRSLNSLSIISLVAFHFQTRDPPILPPFNELLKDGSNPSSVMKLVPNYLDFAKRNNESIGDLFFSFLAKLEAVEKLWSTGLCASSFLGSWISKTDSHIDLMNVEDFTDRSQNVARAVGLRGFKSIYDCIHNLFHHLLAFQNGEIHESTLRELLFRTGTIFTPMGIGVKYLGNNGPNVFHPHQANDMLLVDGWEVKRGTEGWDDWVGQKRAAFGGKRKQETEGWDEWAGQKQTAFGGKRKQETEGWEDWERKEKTRSRDKWKVETFRDRQPVDSRGGKRVKYNGTRTNIASHFTSPVSHHRPHESAPVAFASQYSNSVHFPLPSPSLLGFEESHGPHQSHFRPLSRVGDSDYYRSQFPPPGMFRADDRESMYPSQSARRYDCPVYNPVSRRNRDSTTDQNYKHRPGFF